MSLLSVAGYFSGCLKGFLVEITSAEIKSIVETLLCVYFFVI